MHCSLSVSLLADKPAKQIILGSGETHVSPRLEAISIWPSLFGGRFFFCAQDPQGIFFFLAYSSQALRLCQNSTNDEIRPCGSKSDATEAEYVYSKCVV